MQLPVKNPFHLLMTTDAVGGVWTYTLDLAGELGAHGVRVTVAALGPAPSATQMAQAHAAGVDMRVLDAPLDWLADSETGVAQASQAIAAVARQTHADLIQTHSPAFLARAAMPAPTISVVHSCVATWWDAVHGNDMPVDLRWRARLVAEGLARATLNIAPSRSFACALARAYGGEPPRVVHNARKPAHMPATATADFIFSAGRLWDDGKDLSTLDRAASLCTLPVIAAGPLESPFGSRAAPDHLEAPGALDGPALQALLGRRPIFCSTAVYEPFGLAVLEAAQAGCALVLAAIPTFRELWADAALFAPARDHKAFAAALNALAQDGEWRAALGEAARQRATMFALDRQAREMMDVYGQALGCRRAEAAA